MQQFKNACSREFEMIIYNKLLISNYYYNFDHNSKGCSKKQACTCTKYSIRGIIGDSVKKSSICNFTNYFPQTNLPNIPLIKSCKFKNYEKKKVQFEVI